MRLSIIIPTYRRAHLLGYVLDSLRRQTCKDFDIVVVLKPCGDESEKVVRKFESFLDVVLVLQKSGYVVDALNLGLERVRGDIIFFLDDDAVPSVDLVEKLVKSYGKYKNVGGIAGNVIPAKLCDGKLEKVAENASHIIPSFRMLTFLERVFARVWNVPLEGMEDYLVYITKAGVVEYNFDVSRFAWHRPVKSLLGMGANMSILYEAVEGFRFPRWWVLGLACEQFLGWHLWRKGYNLIFDPDVKVYHLIHGETLTRNMKSVKKDILRWIENYLLFYRLCDMEPKLSWMYRIAWLIFSSYIDLKKICVNGEIQHLNQLRGRFLSEVIGLKWLISRKIGGNYNPLVELEKWLHIT